MLVLIIGGSASGKSQFAEDFIVSRNHAERIYMATMAIWDDESRKRVERHRNMRDGKRFQTVECPSGLDALDVPLGSAVLLEDLSNLAANEFFGVSPEGAEERIIAGIDKLCAQADLFVVVSNELFLDGCDYDAETTAYLDCMAGLNLLLAQRADIVYELVCGLPVTWKNSVADNAEVGK